MKDKLVVEHLNGKRWRVSQPFHYTLELLPYEPTKGYRHYNIKVKAGFETDFASVPRPFWWLYSPTGKWGKDAVAHDWLYRHAGDFVWVNVMVCGTTHHQSLIRFTRKDADLALYNGMKRSGVRLTARLTIYYAVRAAGWLPWLKHRQAREAEHDNDWGM